MYRMADQLTYFGHAGKQGYYLEDAQQLAMSMGETELTYYQDQRRQQSQFHRGSGQQLSPSEQFYPIMHRYSASSCKLKNCFTPNMYL